MRSEQSAKPGQPGSRSSRYAPRFNYLTRRFRIGVQGKRIVPRHNHLTEMVSTYRLARHLTQRQLADAAGLSRYMVHRIETGQADPPVSVALALSAVLRQPVEELFRLGRK